MSREIDPDKIANGTLSEDEERYLSDRNQLPADYERQVEIKAPEAELPPNTGDASLTEPEADPEEAIRRSGAASQDGFKKSKKAKAEAEPEEDEEETDETEDYDEGWTNDTRRAELQKRGLDIEGNKEQLIERLLADDASKGE